MITFVPKLTGDNRQKTACLAAARANQRLVEFADRVGATMTAPGGGIDVRHLNAEGLRQLRKKQAATLRDEFDRDLAPLAQAARAEQVGVARRIDAAIDERFAKAGPLAIEKAKLAITLLSAMPAEAPEVLKFHAAVGQGDEDASLAALLAPSWSSLASTTPIARKAIAAKLPPIPGQRGDFGVQHLPDVGLVEAEALTRTAADLVEAQASMIRTALDRAANDGRWASAGEIPDTSAADLMAQGGRLAPILASARKLGLLEDPVGAARAEAAQQSGRAMLAAVNGGAA